jgi:uncharacterized protein (DUF1697 family)
MDREVSPLICYSITVVYVALLRGINVGGKSKVEMPRLKAAFEALGCKDVMTYINSGNVVFRDERTVKELVSLIEATIKKEFGVEIHVVLRNLPNIRKLCQEIPDSWANDPKQKTDVLFLWNEIDNADILNKVARDPKLENVRYVAGALIWNIGRENVTKGGGVKLIKTDFYQHMTARNINTVRKLYEMMKTSYNK